MASNEVVEDLRKALRGSAEALHDLSDDPVHMRSVFDQCEHHHCVQAGRVLDRTEGAQSRADRLESALREVQENLDAMSRSAGGSFPGIAEMRGLVMGQLTALRNAIDGWIEAS